MLKNKKKKGFTLVELIVVISVLLILAVLAVVAYTNITQSARAAALRADAVSVARSVNTYNTFMEADPKGKIVGQTGMTAPTLTSGVVVTTGNTEADADGDNGLAGTYYSIVQGATLAMTIKKEAIGTIEDMTLSVTLTPARWFELLEGTNGTDRILYWDNTTLIWNIDEKALTN